MCGLSPARTREPAAGPTAGPTIADSPKRYSVDGTRIEAANPVASTQDMTITERTHAYQHLAAQAALDKQWAGQVDLAITDHVLWLDRHKSAGSEFAARLNSMAANLASNATTADLTGSTTGANATAPAPDATDAALRANVQAQDVAMGARLDGAEASLRQMIANLDTGLRAHAQEAVAQTQLAVKSLADKVHVVETARGLSSDVPGTPPGFVSPEVRTAVEAVDTRRRFSELDLRLPTAETMAKAEVITRITSANAAAYAMGMVLLIKRYIFSPTEDCERIIPTSTCCLCLYPHPCRLRCESRNDAVCRRRAWVG